MSEVNVEKSTKFYEIGSFFDLWDTSFLDFRGKKTGIQVKFQAPGLQVWHKKRPKAPKTTPLHRDTDS